MNPDLSEVMRALGDLQGRFPSSTADSIFSALGVPENPIRFQSLFNEETQTRAPARFDERSRQIDVDPLMMMTMAANTRSRAQVEGERITAQQATGRGPTAGILAHEVFHEASVNPDRQIESDDPQVQGLANLIGMQFDSASPKQKKDLFARYYGFQPPEELEGDPITGTRRLEAMAQVVEDAFNIARQADPEDPNSIRGLLEGSLPGTREAVNFFIRRFPNDALR